MHIYVHIPFCHRICPYCAFYKHTPGATDMAGFIEGILREARLRTPEGSRPETLYFGGGTPSMLSLRHFQRLMEGMARHFDLGDLAEFSFEANPATFTEQKVAQWRQWGVNRVSLGVQSWEPRLLALLGRTHTPWQAEESIARLRRAGIPQVNVDLMFSLPGQSLEEWEETLAHTIALNPEHISAYNLTYEEDTEFYRRYGAPASAEDEERDARMFERADELLTQAGYRHYETSNYARADFRSRHNTACWEGRDYYGFGPGAVGTVDGVRYRNGGDTRAYIDALRKGTLPPGDEERLTEEDIRTERLGLYLRTDTGLPPAWIRPQDAPRIESFIREGLAERLENGHVRLIGRGRLLVDAIAVELM